MRAPCGGLGSNKNGARHPQRPYPMDYIENLFTDFSEIHGDRAFGDDPAMTCGMARFNGEECLVIGNLKDGLQRKGAPQVRRADPEGYRKALRAMRIAEKFQRPIFAFVDLAGANPGYKPGRKPEQGKAIARNLLEMSRLRVPTIATITGEGGSGGALALSVADRVLMLENAIYSVISPEVAHPSCGRTRRSGSRLRPR